MPKQTGFLKIQGTLGDVTFYKNKNGYFLRSKGGVSKERIATDPAFRRTRENANEFTTVANAGKLFRDANALFIKKAYDSGLNLRLMHHLAKVKNLDAVSARGERDVSNGLETEAGRALLLGYDLNLRAPLLAVLKSGYEVDLSAGRITLADFVPARMLNAPAGSTHVTLQSALVRIDFEAKSSEAAYSAIVNLPLDAIAATQVLETAVIPVGSGRLFCVLLVAFSQEVNGEQYALHNGQFNSLTVLGVV